MKEECKGEDLLGKDGGVMSKQRVNVGMEDGTGIYWNNSMKREG